MAEKPDKAEKPEKTEKGAKAGEAEAPKEKGGKTKEKKEAAAPKKETWKSDNPNFKYIVRIANTDLDGKHPVEIALAAVKGIGIRTAGVISDLTGVNRAERIGNLEDAQVQELENAVLRLAETVPPWLLNRSKDVESGAHLHVVSTDVEIKLRDDLNRMKKIRSYKGVRHDTGQKVRGQRSRSNGRTGLTMGVQRKAVQQAAAGKKEEEGGKEKKEAAKPAAGAAKPAAGGAAKPAGGKPAEKK
ncbi:MAG TPA: 30S ribosomal protein S13 [Candidatus Thermoplasmatota archaeon]|jgi:small subunit ribosomal protein S13|nr:30S ribosomal protein S13 [Candidatus Thermoplasmatota archaeon]